LGEKKRILHKITPMTVKRKAPLISSFVFRAARSAAAPKKAKPIAAAGTPSKRIKSSPWPAAIKRG